MKRLVVLMCASVLMKETHSAKILGLLSVPAPSHYIFGSALMRGLAEKGHNVTVISAFGEKHPPKNGSYRDIILTGFAEEHNRMVKETNLWELKDLSTFLILPFLIHMMLNITATTLTHPNVQKLLHSEETFDVVIVEEFMNEAHKGIAPHFKAPLILMSANGAHAEINILNANPLYVSNFLLNYSKDMTFLERTKNTFIMVYSHLLLNYYLFPKHKQLYDKYFPNAPNFYDTIYNGSIYFLNSHPSMNQPVPYVPNMIDIGGLHVRPTNKLPKDLQEFLDESEEGVIYFSFGSNWRSSLMPLEKRNAFIRTFKKLNNKILWKWEEDVLPGQPKNVRLGKWLPQQEILAHPNVKLFITHCGIQSYTEAIYHGVPILAIPLVGEQKLNAKKLVSDGFGLSLKFTEVSEETLTKKLNELLQNLKYAENAKQKSRIFHNRQVKPLDTAIYWVEYVIRHGEAQHLKGVYLPWYKYMLLDVFAFTFTVIFAGVYILLTVVKIAVFCISNFKKFCLKCRIS